MPAKLKPRLGSLLGQLKRQAGRLRQVKQLGLDWTDLALVAGLACIVRGLALIYVPLGWIFVGAALCWIGLRAGTGGR